MPRRVPSEWTDKIQEINALLALIEDWKERSNQTSKTSPRWQKLREFLEEIEPLNF